MPHPSDVLREAHIPEGVILVALDYVERYGAYMTSEEIAALGLTLQKKYEDGYADGYRDAIAEKGV